MPGENDQYQVLPRGPTSQPYRTPRRTRRDTGQVEVWIEGEGYVPETDLRRLPQQEREDVAEARRRATVMAQALPDWQEFERLNSQEATGSIGQIAGNILSAPNVMGRPREDQMRAIVSRWVPNQRAAGSGTTSDRDLSFYEGGLPSTARVGPSNSALIRDFERNAATASDYASFLDWYWPRTGSLSGAREAWQEYQAMPRDQRPNWREYFGAPEQRQGTAGPAPQRQANGGQQPQTGQRRTYPNGSVGEWDGHGWRLVQPARGQ